MMAVSFIFLLLILLPIRLEAQTDVSGLTVPLNSTATWTVSGSPYVVRTGRVLVRGDLVIEPGVVVKFDQGAYMEVSGSLRAIGDQDNPIVFTSLKDDEYGGDTNGDGPSQGEPGDWGAICLSSDGEAELEHVLIRWGGSSSTPFTYKANLIAKDSSSLNISSSTVERSAGEGICVCDRASARIEGVTVKDSSRNGISLFGRSDVEKARADIIGCTVQDSDEDGIHIENGIVSLRGTIISNNSFPIGIGSAFSLSHDGTNTISGNECDGAIEVKGQVVNWISGVFPGPDSLPQPIQVYLFTGSPEVPDGKELVIQPGAIFKFNEGCGLKVAGTLRAVGTSDSPIVFTSYRDDEYGGDTNGDGPSRGQPGDWDKLFLGETMGGESQLDHVIIRYGGSGALGGNIQASVFSNYHSTQLDQTTTTFDNCVIEFSAADGLVSDNSLLTLRNVEIRRNNGDGLRMRDNSRVVLEGCSIHDNLKNGVHVDDSELTLNGNTISGNTYPLSFEMSRGIGVILNHDGNNTISGNTYDDVVEIRGESIAGTLYGPDNLPPPLDTYVVGIDHRGVRVPQGTALNVEPGVVIKFKSGIVSLSVYGSLTAVGTEDKPITFTSYKDDEHGGDTNGDGPSHGEPGDWGGIRIYGDNSVLDHVLVLYGGGTSPRSGLLVEGTSPQISGSIFRHNRGDGIVARSGANLNVSGCQMLDNEKNGLALYDSSAQIVSSSLSNNSEAGIYAEDSEFRISHCNIFGNGYPIHLRGEMNFSHELNAISHNTYEVVLVTAGPISGTVYSPSNLPPPISSYLVDPSWGSAYVPEGKSLSIEPGAILKFKSGWLEVRGTLRAIGDEGNEIIFTSYRDDEFGGDTNGDGPSQGQPRDWAGIKFRDTSTGSELRNVVIRYGGGASPYGSLTVIGTDDLTVERCMITRSKYGVYCDGASPVIRGCLITGNEVGIYCRNGALPLIGGSAEFQNDIFDNSGYGVRNLDPGVTVNARFNYWGDPSGPHDPSDGPPLHNPDGEGDEVSDYVDYSSWASAPGEMGKLRRSPDVWVILQGDTAIVPGGTVCYYLWFGNRGQVSAEDVVLQLRLPEGLTYRRDASGLSPSVSADSRTITWNLGTLAPWEESDFFVYASAEEGLMGTLTAEAEISIPTGERNLTNNSSSLDSYVVEPKPKIELTIFGERLRPGFVSEFTIFYTNVGTGPAYDVRIEVHLDDSRFPDGTRRFLFAGPGTVVTPDGVTWEYDDERHVITFYVGDLYPASLEEEEEAGEGVRHAKLSQVFGVPGGVVRSMYGGIIKEAVKWGIEVHRRNQPCTPMGLVIPVFQRSPTAEAMLRLADVPWEVPGHVVGSADPNDKQVTPAGYDWRFGYVKGDRPFNYTIRFENKAEATAEATYITIEDHLDPNLDWSTLQILGIQVGGRLYTPYNYDRGKLSITFDPDTGLLRFFFDGIDLPPNVNPPEGEGMVVYSVLPKPNLPDGTQIRNKATIVFDYNPPIDTPEVVNTIDKTPPSSHVLPFEDDVIYTENFEVRWEGGDALSGVRSYTIYVSTDGGEFEPWLEGTTDTSATFSGRFGHTYSFYSVAVDNVGNEEPPPDSPDVTVHVRTRHLLLGDVTGNGDITAYDAAVILRYLVDKEDLTDEQLAAADVSGNGEVSAYDAAKILQFVVGLIDKLGPEEGAPSMRLKSRTVSLPSLKARPGERISVPILVDDPEGIISGEISLKFNGEALRFIGVRSGFKLESKVDGDRLKLAFAGSKAGGSKALAHIEFEVTNDAFDYAELKLEEVRLNEGVEVKLLDGKVELIPRQTELLQNYPNPFNLETWIPFRLSEGGEVVIRIYDVRGRLVRELDLGYMEAGSYTGKNRAARWDGRNEKGEKVASGVYVYQLRVGRHTLVRKMSVLK